MDTEHKDSNGRLVCGIKGCTASPKIMLAHVKLVHDRVPWTCKQCNKPYYSHNRHKLLHRVDPNTLLTCKECGYKCISENYMKRHKNMLHSAAKPEKILLCNSCDFKTDGLSRDEEFKLMVHKRIHKDGQISCDLCPFKSQKGYTLKIYLKKHLAEEHGLGKVLYCNLCNYKTSANNYMTKHMNNTSHLKEKLFLCDKCEYSGWTKESLKRHMEIHNRTTPKYLCNECDYKCYDGSNFTDV